MIIGLDIENKVSKRNKLQLSQKSQKYKAAKEAQKKIMKELKKASQIQFNSDKEGVWFFIILFIDGNETLVSEFDAIHIESKISL